MRLDSRKLAKRLSRTGTADGESHWRQLPDDRALQCEKDGKRRSGRSARCSIARTLCGRSDQTDLRGEPGKGRPGLSRTRLSGCCAAARPFPGRAGVGGAPTASAVRIRDRFVGAPDLGAVGFAGLWADFRRPLRRPVLRCDLIHADMAAELALVSSGMTIPLSRAISSANDTCAGVAGLEPSSPGGRPPPSAFLRAC